MMSTSKPGGKSSRREQMRTRQRRQKLISTLIWGGLVIAILTVVGVLVWQAVRPAAGEAVTLPANSDQHVAIGTPPGPYNTDPPTGGAHYAETLPAKFYEEADVASLPDYPQGYLVHNLEHGHVIFWYNCETLDDTDCGNLKEQIRGVMEDFDGFKVEAFPWEALDVPVAMTSWDRIQRFESFDPALARAFVRANRNRAPEPNAP